MLIPPCYDVLYYYTNILIRFYSRTVAGTEKSKVIFDIAETNCQKYGSSIDIFNKDFNKYETNDAHDIIMFHILWIQSIKQ